METKAPQSHICFGSLCCEDHGGEKGEREEIAAVEDRKDAAADAIEVMAEREEPAVEVMAVNELEQAMEVKAESGEQAVEVGAASGEPEIEPVAEREIIEPVEEREIIEPMAEREIIEPVAERKIEPVAGREEPAIDIMGESVEPTPGEHVPLSLPPAPLQGSWDRKGANYEEARKRLMQAPAAPAPTEKGPAPKRRMTGIAAPTRAPSGAPEDSRLTRVIDSRWSSSHVEHSAIAPAAAPLGARDDRRKPRVSALSRALSDETRVPAAPLRALPNEIRAPAPLSAPVIPRPVRVAAPNRATLDLNFVTRVPATSPPPPVIRKDAASGKRPGAAKTPAAAKAKAPRAAKPPRASKAKKSAADFRQSTAPPTPKLKLWARPLIAVGCLLVVVVIANSLGY